MMQLTEIHSPSLYVNFDEFCHCTNIKAEHMLQLVEYEIAKPIAGDQQDEWQFNISTGPLANKAIRLHCELDINWDDIKLFLNLLDEIELLKIENNQLKRQLNRFLLGQ